MTDVGVRLSNVTPASAIDDLIGNQVIAGVRRARRINFADLAAQLASTGAVSSALGVISLMLAAGSRVKALYTQLAALPGWAEGDTGFVFGDTLDRNGEYLFTGGQLVRQKALPGDIAEAAANAAIAAAAQIVALLDATANGDLSIAACPLWRWQAAIAAISPAAITTWATSIPPEPNDATRLAIAAGKPVRVGGEIWNYTKSAIDLTDVQMIALMTSALAVAL